MFDKLLESVFQLFGEFTWRRLGALLFVLLIFVTGGITYERYTSSFRLGRIQKETEVLAALRALDSVRWASDSNISAVRARLSLDLLKASEAEPIMPDLAKLVRPFTHADMGWQLLAGAALFWALAAIALIHTFSSKKPSGSPLVIAPLIGLGILASLLGVLLVPAQWSGFVKLFVVPVIITVAFLLVLWFKDAFANHYRAAKAWELSKNSVSNQSSTGPAQRGGTA